VTPLRSALPLLLVLALFAPAAQAGEACYLLMFGSQRVPGNPKYSHTFATFVRATWTDRPPPVGPCQMESFTISWLPQSLDVRVFAPLPECGVNLTLDDTLRHVIGCEERVSMWGPYRIDPKLYDLAREQRGRLESGAVQYKAVDAGYDAARVSNCIHAVANAVAGPRVRVASPGWGETASYAVLRRFMPYVQDDCLTYPLVATALGLEAYPIIYRDVRAPRSGALVGPFNRLFGGERGLTATYGP
jgi:hypothetical protein